MFKKLFFLSAVLFVLLSLCLVVVVEASSTTWNQTYGGTGFDRVYSLVATSDGGYALAGYTTSLGAGGSDFWLVKTDEFGNMEWNQTYGGTSYDYGRSVVETSDGGYAIAGTTESFGAGGYDCWLVKTDEFGTMEWNRTYGGANDDFGYSVVETFDGGYVIAGITISSNWICDPTGDIWLIKTDSFGNVEWTQTYGRAEFEAASVVKTSDGGYAIAGTTESFGAGGFDVWLVKTDAFGNVEWNQTYGGTSYDYGRSVVETSDGGYAIAGSTDSFGDGLDFWLVKTDPTGNMEWNRTYEGSPIDRAWSLVQTPDGGYAIAGETYSPDSKPFHFWLIKTDEYGIPEYSSWLLPTVLLTATLVIVVYKKKLLNRRS